MPQTCNSRRGDRGAIAIMAFTAGAAISNVYYNQPMLQLIAHDLGIDSLLTGLVPASTMGGFALGNFLLLPLGDRFNRKTVVLCQLAVTVVSLAGAAAAPSLPILLLAGVGIGLSSTVAQQIVPFAASIAPPEMRGRYVGSVVSAILLGILLGRAVGGIASQFYGWRAVYSAAAVVMCVVAVIVGVWLPSSRPTTKLSYPRLLASLVPLLRKHPTLREAILTQASLWAGFNVFWATLATLLADEPYRLGSAWAGAFGLVGALGAIAASLGGRISDRLGSRGVVGVCIALVFAAFVILIGATWLLAALIVGVVVLDFGVQAALAANQSRAFALDPSAQSRLNTIFMTTMFIGASIGAAGSALAWTLGGWPAVASYGGALAIFGLVVHCWYSPKSESPARTAAARQQ